MSHVKEGVISDAGALAHGGHATDQIEILLEPFFLSPAPDRSSCTGAAAQDHDTDYEFDQFKLKFP